MGYKARGGSGYNTQNRRSTTKKRTGKRTPKNDDYIIKNNALWAAQYAPRLAIIKKLAPEAYAKLKLRSIGNQMVIIDNMQRKGYFDPFFR